MPNQNKYCLYYIKKNKKHKNIVITYLTYIMYFNSLKWYCSGINAT